MQGVPNEPFNRNEGRVAEFRSRSHCSLSGSLLQTRQVFIGLCLPGTCEHSSVKSLLRASADRVERQGDATHRAQGPKIHIVQVRRVPSSDYSPWSDPKFYALA